MAAPGGSAAAGQLQLPHMAAGPGGAGQVSCVWVSVGVIVCVCVHERESVGVCTRECGVAGGAGQVILCVCLCV